MKAEKEKINVQRWIDRTDKTVEENMYTEDEMPMQT